MSVFVCFLATLPTIAHQSAIFIKKEWAVWRKRWLNLGTNFCIIFNIPQNYFILEMVNFFINHNFMVAQHLVFRDEIRLQSQWCYYFFAILRILFLAIMMLFLVRNTIQSIAWFAKILWNLTQNKAAIHSQFCSVQSIDGKFYYLRFGWLLS